MSLIVKQFYCFGDFMVDIGQKVLLHQGKITPLTPKVFDTLLVLIENRGRIVEKKELMNRLWPDSFVEESNLTFNIQQLRKGLGDNARQPRFIETVARRGYRFIVPVEEVSTDDSSSHITQLGSVDSSVKEGGPGFRSKNSLSSQTATPAGIEGQNQSFEIAIAGGSSLRRHRKRLSALAITLTVVLVGAAVVLWEISNASRKSLGDLVATLPLRVERLTASGQSNNAAISPDGKYLAYTRTVEGKQSVWMRQLAANTNVEIVPAGDKIFGVA